MNSEEAVEYLLNNDKRFEVVPAEIRGVKYNRVFKNTPPNLRAMLQDSVDAYGAESCGDGEMLVYQDERWTYNQFCKDVKRMANALKEQLNVRPGDRVAIAMRNYPEFPILLMAIVSAGAVAVPVNSWWTGEELAYAIEDSNAKVVFADGPRYNAIQSHVTDETVRLVAVREAEGPLTYAELRDNAAYSEWPKDIIEPDDDFAILYSSGSTGHPKGIALTHRGAISAIYTWIMGREMAPMLDGAPPVSETPHQWLIVTPLFHVTALHANFLQGIVLGAKMFLFYKWDVEEVIQVIKKEKATRVVAVPTLTAELMEAANKKGEKLETLEGIGAGGAKSPSTQITNLAKTFPGANIYAGWGMTETNSLGITIAGPEYVAHPNSIGRLNPPLQEIRLEDEEGNLVPQGEAGEIVIKSPANMRCYLNKAEATDEVLQDGWLKTGDMARVDEEGRYYIVDRKKNIIIRGGENISCLEVEDALHSHPDIKEACVFSIPDEKLGEIVGTAIYLEQDKNTPARDLATHLYEHIAMFKIPEKYWFWQEPLPRGVTFKVDHRQIRSECLEMMDKAIIVKP